MIKHIEIMVLLSGLMILFFFRLSQVGLLQEEKTHISHTTRTHQSNWKCGGNESTDISNIQLQWRSKFEHLENAFNWFLKISTISNLPSNSSMRNSPKTIERTTELWKWKLSISKVDKIPLQAPTLSHVIMPCGGGGFCL